MSRYGRCVLYAALIMVVGSVAVSGKPTIPFADALDGASISVDRLDDILKYALIIGNGDINALVYTDSGNIELVLTKSA